MDEVQPGEVANAFGDILTRTGELCAFGPILLNDTSADEARGFGWFCTGHQAHYHIMCRREDDRPREAILQ